MMIECYKYLQQDTCTSSWLHVTSQRNSFNEHLLVASIGHAFACDMYVANLYTVVKAQPKSVSLIY